MNFIKHEFFHESAPNRSSRPLNTQFLLEISIRIQWKTSRGQNKIENRVKLIIISLTPIPLRGLLCSICFVLVLRICFISSSYLLRSS